MTTSWISRAGTGRPEAYKTVLAMWWNTENLFDPGNDPATDDDDFTPDGKLNWTAKKLILKQMRIRHLLMAVNAHPEYRKYPDIVALAEVENRNVFQRTLSGIQGVSYKTVYYDSPDPRGIDIGLAYNPRHLTLASSKAYSVNLGDKPTRKIIVAGFSASAHSLHIILNHWPSRSFDTGWTEPKRLAAAKVARHILDSLRLGNSQADIVTMGDFNDEPGDRSLKEGLGSSFDAAKVRANPEKLLYNCWNGYRGIGSYSYHNKWQHIDQILLSGGMLDNRGFTASNDAFRCFFISRMLDCSGKKTWPTYEKRVYKGGYSDHLPLLLNIHFAK
jgi:endonuclease/exonuclease/phosphatase family metal-dependent hydrolase